MKNKGYSAEYYYGDLLSDHYMSRRYSQNYSLLKCKLETKKKIEILDVGGYCGDLYEFIKRRDPRAHLISYTVLDYDNKALDIARFRGAKGVKIDFNYDDIVEKVKSKKYDVIICTEVLEHLLDPDKHLKSFTKILKKDGFAVISLPNENTIFHRLYALLGMGVDQYPFTLYKHLHFPTISQSTRFVSKYFLVEDKKYYINFSGKGSRFGIIGRLFELVPDPIWDGLTGIFPGLLARGVIFRLRLC